MIGILFKCDDYEIARQRRMEICEALKNVESYGEFGKGKDITVKQVEENAYDETYEFTIFIGFPEENEPILCVGVEDFWLLDMNSPAISALDWLK